jgi:hypothetical protein
MTQLLALSHHCANCKEARQTDGIETDAAGLGVEICHGAKVPGDRIQKIARPMSRVLPEVLGMISGFAVGRKLDQIRRQLGRRRIA